MRPGPPLLLAAWLLLAPPAGRAAPKEDPPRVLQDPLGAAGQDSDSGAPSREQALARLIALHDADHSGRLDGLQLLWLLSRLASPQARGDPAPDQVVLMVDRMLESWDFNRDGELEPSELFLGPWQGPPPPGAPAAEEWAVLWAASPAEEPRASPPGPHGREGPGEAPAVPQTAQPQGQMEAPSLKHTEGAGQDQPQPQQEGAEAPPSAGG
ncbi:cell growth regulator with EF hand domain protein 1 [Varanus komodoensis]|uniref:cell growth regulator with EF hand domain protein 1 n=1 Tax=Varanus komodoensis TaxID=61221 RepID=UPI001CF779E5|nr:cell growth regulator with EF hand domain protein 1 [Varanus komodoensis]